MKPRYRKILINMIETGFHNGWNYSYQYTDYPSKDYLKQAILDHIMNELDEWFVFDENKND